jgi:hypothetical protein
VKFISVSRSPSAYSINIEAELELKGKFVAFSGGRRSVILVVNPLSVALKSPYIVKLGETVVAVLLLTTPSMVTHPSGSTVNVMFIIVSTGFELAEPMTPWSPRIDKAENMKKKTIKTDLSVPYNIYFLKAKGEEE